MITPPPQARQDGFSLIELLVVILVIAILAAVAIPVFLGQRERGQDTRAKAESRSAHTALETFRVSSETYDASVNDLLEVEPTLANAVNLSVTGTASTFTISVDSAAGHTFGVRKVAPGAVERFCRPAGEGSCPANGRW